MGVRYASPAVACRLHAMKATSIACAGLFLLFACGGSTSSPSGGVDDGGIDATQPSDASTGDGAAPMEGGGGGDAAGGCISQPAEGTACTPGQVSCDRVDPCCASSASCDPVTKTWKLSGMACLLCQTHGCGDKTCKGNEMCVAHAPGIPSGQPSYSCAAYPTACAREWTCGCVQKNLPSGCTLAANGCNDSELPVKLSCMGI